MKTIYVVYYDWAFNSGSDKGILGLYEHLDDAIAKMDEYWEDEREMGYFEEFNEWDCSARRREGWTDGLYGEMHDLVEVIEKYLYSREDAAIAMVAEQIPATISSKAGVTCGITIDDFEVKCHDLMDASNNHDTDLVERINLAWQSKRHEFIDIVRLLVKRDVWDENPEFFEQSVEDQCRVYCQNIADDKDLRVILDYCRA